jgi:hypothetical protein
MVGWTSNIVQFPRNDEKTKPDHKAFACNKNTQNCRIIEIWRKHGNLVNLSSRKQFMEEKMSSQLDATMIQTIKSAARKLRGADRRAFQAEATRDYCKASPRIAERTFGWNRDTVQKGLDEMATGEIVPDAPKSGCPGFFERLPSLQDDIRSLVDPNSQTHPTFDTSFRYTRMTADAVREALVQEKGYKREELPAESTMRALLNKMGYRLRRVQKTKPQKKFPKPMRSSRTSTPRTNEATKSRKHCESR